MSVAVDNSVSETRWVTFESLYRSYQVVLKRVALMLCGDRALADDLVQETWLRAWRAMGSLHDAGAARRGGGRSRTPLHGRGPR